MKFVVKLSSTEYTNDGLKITAFGKFSFTLFSPSNLLIAYLLSTEASIPSAYKLINFFIDFFLATFDSKAGKSECIILK